MKDTDNMTLFALWLLPETRWITAWDFMRRNEHGIEDAILVFHNIIAAEEARRHLPPIVAEACSVAPIISDVPPAGKG